MSELDVAYMPLADGQNLAYRTAGESENGIPLLFIHGLPDASDTWLPLITEVVRSHRVYAVDLAGYGHSARPKNYDVSIAAQSNYLRAFVNALDIEKAILVGHDIGGGIAQIIAAKDPSRVAGLVLINPIVDQYWPVLETRMLRVPLLAPLTLRVFEKLMWKHIIAKGLSNSKEATEAMIARYQQWYRRPQGRRRLLRNTRALRNTDLTTWSAAIRALAVPTLLLWGRNDRYLQAKPAQGLCQTMRNCRFEFIDGAGHYVLDEQSHKVATHILQFIGTLGAPSDKK